MTWTRLRNTRDPQSAAKVFRVYGLDGADYPRLCIGVYTSTDTDFPTSPGLKISVSYKQKRGGWWDEAWTYVPLELVPELPEIIAEAAATLKE